MHRVVTIQSLKFAEIREHENQRKEEKYSSSSQSNLSRIKKQKQHDESNKQQSDDQPVGRGSVSLVTDQSNTQPIAAFEPDSEKSITVTYHDKRDTQSTINQAGNQSTNQSQNQTILLIDDVIRRRRDQLHRPPRGVWNQLGVAYEVDGVDLMLGNMSKQAIKEAIKAKKPRATNINQSINQSDKDATYPTRKVEALIEAFRQARIKMLQTSHEPMRRTDDQLVHPSLNVPINQAINALNVGPALKQNRFPAIHDSPTRASQQQNEASLNQASNQAITQSLPFHLAGSRVDHISRWRAQFDSTKQTNDRELIKKLVARAETRGAVFQQVDYMENALQTIMKRKSGKRAQSINQSMRMDERWQAAIEQEFGFALKSPTQPKSNEVIEREIREALEHKQQEQQQQQALKQNVQSNYRSNNQSYSQIEDDVSRTGKFYVEYEEKSQL